MTRRALAIAALVVLGGVAAGGLWGWRQSALPPDVEAWRAKAAQAARAHDLDPHLVLAMVAAESGGNERAVSQAGARGLLQLMLPTAKEQASKLRLPEPDADALLDGDLSLKLGTAYFRYLMDRFDGDEVFAIAAYNAGPTAVRRWGRRALDVSSMDVIDREGYPETRAHVRRVLRYRAALAKP